MTSEPSCIFNVENTIGLSFGNPISELFRIVRYVEANKNNTITISFKNCRFGSPVILLGIKMLEQYYQREGYSVETDRISFSRDFNGYLACISFQDLLLPDRFSPDGFRDHIRLYIEKTYFPMVSFPARLTDIASIYREYLLDAIGVHLKNRLALSGRMYQAISYLLDEIVNNVKDHSREERGYIFTQFYASRGLLDICIGDLGIQFMGSYQNIGRADIDTNEKALQSALMGESSKLDIMRGFGFRTSKNLLVNGLKGKFFLISGNAFLYSAPDVPDRIRTLDAHAVGSWPGTMVYMRIPFAGSSDFDFYQFVE